MYNSHIGYTHVEIRDITNVCFQKYKHVLHFVSVHNSFHMITSIPPFAFSAHLSSGVGCVLVLGASRGLLRGLASNCVMSVSSVCIGEKKRRSTRTTRSHQTPPGSTRPHQTLPDSPETTRLYQIPQDLTRLTRTHQTLPDPTRPNQTPREDVMKAL